MRKHDAARALLRLGANPNALDAERYDIVTIAAVNNDLEMLKIALEGGGNARAITSPYDGTALIAAAHRGHVEVVRALIAAKAPLNHVNNLGWTALLEAVVLGNGGSEPHGGRRGLGQGRRRRHAAGPARHDSVGTCPHARLFADRAHPGECRGALIQRARCRTRCGDPRYDACRRVNRAGQLAPQDGVER